MDTTAFPLDEVTAAADTTTAAGSPTGELQNSVYYTHVFENNYIYIILYIYMKALEVSRRQYRGHDSFPSGRGDRRSGHDHGCRKPRGFERGVEAGG